MAKGVAALLVVLALTACGTAPAGQAPPLREATVMATPLPDEAVPAAPVILAPAPALPAQMTVSLGALAPGTYTVHLHTICNGGTAFHITTLGFVNASEPVLTLPAGDFGKGWCLVLYTDPSATKVVTYRPI
jgi:hypothetical protein